MPEEETIHKVMKVIEGRHLHPIPKWRFFVRRILLWILWGLSSIFGAIAFSLILLLVLDEEWVEYQLLNGSILEAFFRMFPVLWIFVFVLLCITAYLAIRKTRHGYRLYLWGIVGINLVFSIFLGSILHMTRVNHLVDNELGRSIPWYASMEDQRETILFQPEEGKIIGEVVRVGMASKTITLRDPSGNMWEVTVLDEDTKGVLENITVGISVGAMGKVTGEGIFEATRIRIIPTSLKMQKDPVQDGEEEV